MKATKQRGGKGKETKQIQTLPHLIYYSYTKIHPSHSHHTNTIIKLIHLFNSL